MFAGLPNEKTSYPRPRVLTDKILLLSERISHYLKSELKGACQVFCFNIPIGKSLMGKQCDQSIGFPVALWDIASDSSPKSSGERWNWITLGTCSLFLFILWVSLHKVSLEEKKNTVPQLETTGMGLWGSPMFVSVGKWNDLMLGKVIWKV